MPAVSFPSMIKILMRSRSISLTADIVRQFPTVSLSWVRWSGRDICYRRGTTDPFVLYQVLLKRGKKAEYYLPPPLQPKMILDIGSNIGASIIFFHKKFPGARIFGFEPHPDTFRILEENVGDMPNVRIFNYGLGASRQRIAVRAGKVNFAAFNTSGRFKDREEPGATVECDVRRLDEVLREVGITQVDLIKIDCEGAEAEVFSTLPDEILNHCQWIGGEFHDHTGFEVLARLAPCFHLDLKKKMFHPQFRFHACNISKAKEMSRADVDALQR